MVTIQEFATLWQHETKATLAVFNNLTDAVLKEKFNENVRTLAMLANHIILTNGEMGSQAGLPVKEKSGKIETVKDLVATYTTEADALLAAVKNAWTDEALKEEVMMYGQSWTKGAMLTALIMHQCHHRGQMTVLMRLAGLKVPGVYGPAKEEWSAMGMEAPVE